MSNTPKVPNLPKINVPRFGAIEEIAKRAREAALAYPALDGVTMPAPLLEIPSHAEMMYKKLVKQIIEFESKLSPEEEIGGRIIAAPRDGVMHITDMKYRGDDMLIFYGT